MTRPAIWLTAFPDQARKLTRDGRKVSRSRVKAPGARQKPVRHRSKRMTKLMAYYNRIVKPTFLLAHPNCAVHEDSNVHPADQIHHCRGRLETLLIDQRFFKGVCLAGHDFIQDHPDMARRLGLLASRGDWNRAPEDAETRRLKEKIQELTR